MTAKDKKKFITLLMNQFWDRKEDILRKVPQMPNEIELRRYIADKAHDEAWRYMKRGQLQAYNKALKSEMNEVVQEDADREMGIERDWKY